MLQQLSNNGIDVQGIDVSAEAVNLCKKRKVPAIQLNVDKAVLPFQNEFFDAVICGEIIEHLFDPDHLLEEVHRILSADGKLILTTPNLGWWLNRITLMLGYQPYNTEVSSRHNLGKLRKVFESVSGHIRPYTYRALKELVRLYGFVIVDSFGTHKLSMPYKILKLIDRQLSKKVSFACNIGIVCQKHKAITRDEKTKNQ